MTKIRETYKPALSALCMPPGSDHSYQYSSTSVHNAWKDGGPLTDRTQQWRSQQMTPPMPIDSSGETFRRTRKAATCEPRAWGHHSSKFYADKFHLLNKQSQGMGMVGHDPLSLYPNAKVYRQTTLTELNSPYNNDVGTHIKRRGKHYRDVPLCLTSTRVVSPLGKMVARPIDDGFLRDTLSRAVTPAARRDMSNTEQINPPTSPTSKYTKDSRGPGFLSGDMLTLSPGRNSFSADGLRSPSRELYSWSYRQARNVSSGRTLTPASAYH